MRIDPLDDLAVELEHEAQHAVRGRMLRPEVDGEVAQRAFRHHTLSAAVAASAALAAFATTLALNFSHGTTKRSWRPLPIWSTPSCATTLKEIFRPATSVHSTSTVTLNPGGVAAVWFTSICTPRLPSPASRCGAISCMHAHSIRPTM